MILRASRTVKLGLEYQTDYYLGSHGLLAHIMVRLSAERVMKLRNRTMYLQLHWNIQEKHIVTIRSGTMTVTVRGVVKEVSQLRSGQFPWTLDGAWSPKCSLESNDEVQITVELDVDEEAPFRTATIEAVRAHSGQFPSHGTFSFFSPPHGNSIEVFCSLVRADT